jgi:trans-2,3-dihydro-3-hydroxyanthranilate isomerase
MNLTYHLLDVFTDVPFGGNPLAVFPHADGIPADLMQRIARELQLSETVFVHPPADAQAADFRVRIFTPAIELPMAGHPTVGTGYLLRHLGMSGEKTRLRFEEGVGLIEVGLEADGSVTMTQPLPTFGAIFPDRYAMAALLSLNVTDLIDELPAQAVSTGVPFLFIPIRTLAAIGRIKFRVDVWERAFRMFEAPHIFAFTPRTVSPEAQVHSRMFAPAMNIPEDAATGAASGPLGAYLVQYGVASAHAAIVAEQGYEMGRPSQIRIAIRREGERFTHVSIGGRCVYMGRGELMLP